MSPSLQVAGSAHLFDRLHAAIMQVERVVLGKQQEVKLAFTALAAGGHLLLDDLPGMGKTTLARALAATLDMGFQRVQFTSDLMPADIVGMNVLETSSQGGFRFHQGPVFTNLLLADEINRASPRTQSALLEAMAEEQVTIDGHTYSLPDPFFVIATQNPVDMAGTFPLPDSQLDRFLFRMAMGYPDAETELSLLAGESSREQIAHLHPQLNLSQVHELRRHAQSVKIERPALVYVQSLLQQSRSHTGLRVGLSPRAGIALVSAAKAYAMINGRSHVIPDDVQDLFIHLASHRLVLDVDTGPARQHEIAKEILSSTKVP